MGSGAVKGAIQESTQNDMEKLFRDLPADEVEKVLKAAKAAHPCLSLGKEAGNEDTENDTTSAPYLRKAFTYLADTFSRIGEKEEAGASEDDIIKAFGSPEDILVSYLELLEQSFNHHDKTKTGTLNDEEAASFFKNLVKEACQLQEAMMVRKIKKRVAADRQILKEGLLEAHNEFPNALDHIEGAVKAAEAEFKKLLLTAKALIKGTLKAFDSNKDALSRQGFKAADADGDGSLSLDEFKEIMKLGSEKNDEFMTVLGISDDMFEGLTDMDSVKDEARNAMAKYMEEKLGVAHDD